MTVPTAEGAPAKPGKSPQQAVKPKTPPPVVDLRALVVKQALWGVAHEPQIHYAQVRPIPVHDKPGTLPLTTDCSGSVTLWAKWAGAPDPNGRGFDGQGYTGTLLDHCKHIPFSALRAGDLIVYGPYPGHHVVQVTSVVKDKQGHVTDAWCVSHGQERGPQKILHSVEAGYQPTPAQALSYLP